MKRLLIIALAITASASFFTADAAKKKTKNAAEAAAAVEAPVQLVTSSDSVSYAGGMSLTRGLIPFLVQQQGVDTTYMADFIRGFREAVKAGADPKMKAYAAGMEIAGQVRDRMLPGMTSDFTDSPDSIVAALLYRGFEDALEADSTVFTQAAAETYFRQKHEADMAAKQEKLYEPNRDAGRKFLEENAKRDSVVTLPSGLQYQVLVKGEGEVPQATDKVKVNYEGRLIDGTVFDASARHGSEPAEFTPQQVIKGWTEALTMMPVGSKWRLFIPSDLAYGDRDQGQIKPYSTLIFDVELVEIVKK
jgi:FKBP-type peptidyl-prolyl cis-trans isomerase FklB